MKAWVKTKPGVGADFIDVEEPIPSEDEIVLKVESTSICGSDIHIWEWDEFGKNVKIPMTFGHEVCGTVVDVGKNVKDVKPGDYGAVESHIVCGECYQCRTGNAHICENVKGLGFDVPGSYASFLKIPEKNFWKVDRSIPPEVVCMLEPFGNAVFTVLVDEIADKSVLIVGGGPIGLMSAMVAKACGAFPIILSEPAEFRREMAMKIGVDYVINPHEISVYEFVMDLTYGRGVDVFLEMSGNQNGLLEGLKSTRRGGRVSLLGIFPSNVTVDLNHLVILRGLKIYGIYGRKLYETWYQSTKLVYTGKVDLAKLITHKLKLEELPEGIRLLKEKKGIKVVLFP